MHGLVLSILLISFQTALAAPKDFKKPNRDELKKKLSELQFRVTQDEGTEAPFKNDYWNLKDDGIYVDVVSGEALFSARDKYDSGTGWPTFTKPIEPGAIVTRESTGPFGPQLSARSKLADSHLGEIYKDGPPPTGLRFTVNSAALRFIALKDLEAQGYGDYRVLFARGAPKEAISTPDRAKKSKTLEEKATFAGGCFWSIERAFEGMEGVVSVTSGFTGGKNPHPSYSEVSKGDTGHAEAVEIVFRPSAVSYRELLEIFFKESDPTDKGGQFCDRGSQYRSEIFFHSEEQKKAAEEMKTKVAKELLIKGSIVTAVTKAGPFYPAEEIHQDYAAKNPVRYKFYSHNCGRAKRLGHLWGSTSESFGF